MTQASAAVIIERLENPVDFIVADGTGIEKGTLCKMTDPRTAAASDGSGDVCAGIAAREKVASDGRTRLAIYRRGIFDMAASGAINVGQAVQSAGDGWVLAAAATSSGASIIGHALETAAATEMIEVYLDIGAGSSALS